MSKSLRDLRRAAGLPAVTMTARQLREANPELAARYARFVEKNRQQILNAIICAKHGAIGCSAPSCGGRVR